MRSGKWLAMRNSVVCIVVAVLTHGCVHSPEQARFLSIDGLASVSTDLARPEAWQTDEDALWARERLSAAGETGPSFIAGVECEDPGNRDAYSAVWIVRSQDGGSLVATRRYVIASLLRWAEGEQRELGAVPVIENVILPLTAPELDAFEHSLRRLSPQKCTDTVVFFPEWGWTYHVSFALDGRDHAFSVFRPALSELEREANKSIRHLAEYDRLSRREADVVSLVLHFADEKLIEHFKVGPKTEPLDQSAPAGFERAPSQKADGGGLGMSGL